MTERIAGYPGGRGREEAEAEPETAVQLGRLAAANPGAMGVRVRGKDGEAPFCAAVEAGVWRLSPRGSGPAFPLRVPRHRFSWEEMARRLNPSSLRQLAARPGISLPRLADFTEDRAADLARIATMVRAFWAAAEMHPGEGDLGPSWHALEKNVRGAISGAGDWGAAEAAAALAGPAPEGRRGPSPSALGNCLAAVANRPSVATAPFLARALLGAGADARASGRLSGGGTLLHDVCWSAVSFVDDGKGNRRGPLPMFAAFEVAMALRAAGANAAARDPGGVTALEVLDWRLTHPWFSQNETWRRSLSYADHPVWDPDGSQLLRRAVAADDWRPGPGHPAVAQVLDARTLMGWRLVPKPPAAPDAPAPAPAAIS